jgi:membrane protease subunit HflC
MSSFKIISGIGLLVFLFGILSSFFTVDQTQQALVLQFGEPKRLVNKPGLNFKIPFIQEVTYFEKRVLSLVSQDSEEVILADQKRLEVDTYSRFRITDPL